MVAQLISVLKDDYGLILKVDAVNVSFFSNWPKASIQLKNIYVASDNIYGKDKPMITAGSISLSLDVLKLLKKQFMIESVAINNAEINLIKYSGGYKNFELKSKENKATSKPIKFEIKKIAIKNTQFNFIDKERGQNINLTFIDNIIKLKHKQGGTTANFFGGVKIGGLLFKPQKGPFLTNTIANLDLQIIIFNKRKSIFIHSPSIITIDNHTFKVNSFMGFDEKKQLILSIESENINYEKGVKLLNTNLQKNLSNINLTKPIDAKILLITRLGVKQDPIIIASIATKNNSATIGNSKIPYSNLSFKAIILSLDSSKNKGDTEHAKVILNDIKGNLYDFPFMASVVINNFDNPNITVNGNLVINASKIKFKPGKDFILKGNCVAKIKYTGPTNKLNKKEFLDEPMKLNADIYFKHLNYREINKPHEYTINGKANLTNKDLKFDNLLLNTIAGNITLKGNVKNFTDYVFGYSNGFKSVLTARAETFNLNPFLATKINKKDTLNSNAYKKTIKEEQSNFEFDVSLFAKKLLIRKIDATNASINLVYKNKLLDIKSVNMNTCNGKLFAKGTIFNLNKITAEVKIEDVDVNKLFIEFENFGQKAIQSDNLQGNMFIDAKFKTSLDDNMEVISNTMDGEIKLKLKEGHLLNFEPLQKISDYIFRKRDFTDISFNEISETCTIKGYQMNIQELEIASNVLNLFVSGKYDFKENSNINILIPWSNLKKRGENYIPKSSGQTAENSKGLKLNYSGLPKKLKLSLGHN